ncbi:hypothetical protein GUITHDRAFT_136770 [Guillardia theta CCMP2712]|uniref:Uncharacterized protein n=1 Tax=Guillardia theta (strain CCMP2712) TaxID=905079 RepID=L1JI96_GUITC|nr:hypothetical protein GUITHDRAFT_136770 [Guillardia theta CCMP2712]EKX48248.1 hypothetical protein GUITHDRAFT_136770 [Guillardia theta CCMP2712]|eukprot:XP_005835228.1 hypothetical protein GUITHDRAFT_136770 [Guillardia theta CCMP2712]
MKALLAFLIFALASSLVGCQHVEFLSPSNGSSFMEPPLEGISLHARVMAEGETERVTKVVVVGGVEALRTEEASISLQTEGISSPGIVKIEIRGLDSRGTQLYKESIFVMIANVEHRGLNNITCEAMGIQRAEALQARAGFGSSKWEEMRHCLFHFLSLWPDNDAANFHLARLMEAEGDFEAAGSRYGLVVEHGVTQLQSRVREVELLALQERDRRSCTWRSLGTCEAGADESCPSRQSIEDVEISKIVNTSSMYLSVIMVTRHDNTQFCQVPKDACLDRFRASISVLVSLLKETNLDDDAELILVEWNPCYVNSKKEEGACDDRGERYLSVEEMVKDLVEARQTKLVIRILFVSEEVHDSLYNPYDFDLMEFIGKNVAARRARGKFLLFANPDDVWSHAIVNQIARKKLREDVFYGTFRGFVMHHVPDENDEEPMRRFSPHAPNDGATKETVKKGGRGEDEDYGVGKIVERRLGAVHKIRGYPEIPTNIMIDGTAIHAAAAHGFGQLLFSGPCVIFHQPHPRSYNTKGSMISLQAYESLAQASPPRP